MRASWPPAEPRNERHSEVSPADKSHLDAKPLSLDRADESGPTTG